MKKKIPFLITLVILMISSFSATHLKASPLKKNIFEFRTSYFYPTSSHFRQLFHDGGVNYQLSGIIPIYKGQNRWAQETDLWIAVDYFSDETHSKTLNNKMNIRIIPVTVGLKHFFPHFAQYDALQFYAAGGLKYYFVHTHNNSDYAQKTINKDGLGGVIEMGLFTSIQNCWILDIFTSYSFVKFGTHESTNPAIKRTTLNLSGVNVGAGIAYKF